MVSKPLQENILALLCFSNRAAAILVNTVTPDLFENDIFVHVSSVAISYFREYKKAVGVHLADLLEERLKNPLYKDVIESLYALSGQVNEDFVLKELGTFLRQQNLKQTVKYAVDLMQDEDYDGIEAAFSKCKKTAFSIFDPGTWLVDTERSFKFLDEQDISYRTGIPELDMLGNCPAPKELFTIMGRSGGSKSWFLIHLGKFLLLQKKKVLHITLELSEEKTTGRYMQSLFAIPKKDKELVTTQLAFTKSRQGSVLEFEEVTNRRDFSLEHPAIRKKLEKILGKSRNMNLFVKEFPSSQLTYKMLVAYLDQLFELHGFSPDALLLDYADLMRIDRTNLRQSLGGLYVELRGLATERNMAVITVSQANRSGSDAEVLTRDHFAEDASKSFTSDVTLTLNRTDAEKNYGLLRIYVDKGRNNKDGQTILISNNLDTGQFCVDSAFLYGSAKKLYKTAGLGEEERKAE